MADLQICWETESILRLVSEADTVEEHQGLPPPMGWRVGSGKFPKAGLKGTWSSAQSLRPRRCPTQGPETDLVGAACRSHPGNGVKPPKFLCLVFPPSAAAGVQGLVHAREVPTTSYPLSLLLECSCTFFLITEGIRM